LAFFFTGVLKWIVIFAPLAAIFGISYVLCNNPTKGVAQLCLHGFAALMGLSFATIFAVFNMGSIVSAFMGAAILFGVMSGYGYFTKKDLSSIGQMMFVGLIAIVIASIDIQNQTASLLSIPRDTWVNVNGDTMKINAAYSMSKQQATYKGKSKEDAENAGISTAISAVRNVAGVPIHKYVLSDYKAFRDVVNALGGVDVNLPSPIIDGFTGWTFKAGPQTMNGDRALEYARTRQGSARGDFDRNENQTQY
jgi:LCP family protein required for cell wall assembly